MSWARILSNDVDSSLPLQDRVNLLFAQQRREWPALRVRQDTLPFLPTKTLTSDSGSITVQLNEARAEVLPRRSPGACPLCSDNLPPDERGVAYEDLIVLPNLYPCLPLHCTVVSRAHEPQAIGGRFKQLLQLSRELGPRWAVTYNGPRCGASAPDHFHFQCVDARGLPILREFPQPALRQPIAVRRSFGRSIYVFVGTMISDMEALVAQTISALSKEATAAEPLLNLAAHYDEGRFSVFLFPRLRHRPISNPAPLTGRMLVRPGVLEMCGLFIVTTKSDFERLTVDRLRLIYQEVCADVDPT